jgi:hypothetical protein
MFEGIFKAFNSVVFPKPRSFKEKEIHTALHLICVRKNSAEICPTFGICSLYFGRQLYAAYVHE